MPAKLHFIDINQVDKTIYLVDKSLFWDKTIKY